MTKRILKMFLLLALAVGAYAVTAKADGVPGPTSTAQPPTQTATSTPSANTCEVQTGIERGAVNLRTCAGTSCAVKKVLTEGESLTIHTVGTLEANSLWLEVTTADGGRGWLNSKYCKGK